MTDADVIARSEVLEGKFKDAIDGMARQVALAIAEKLYGWFYPNRLDEMVGETNCSFEGDATPFTLLDYHEKLPGAISMAIERFLPGFVVVITSFTKIDHDNKIFLLKYKLTVRM